MESSIDKRYALGSWSDKMCIQLIKEYRDRPILWDPQDSLYFKRTHKQNAWKSISGSLGMQPWECKHKMGILLSSFRREKMKQLRAGTRYTDSKSTWFAFPYLKFLIEKDGIQEENPIASDESDGEGSVKSEYSTDDGSEEPLIALQSAAEDCKIVETLDDPKNSIKSDKCTTDEDTDNEDVNSSPETESNPQKRKSPPTDLSLLEREETPGSSQKRSRPESDTLNLFYDELDTFVKYIHSKMKKYSQAKMYQIQRDICEILFKADRELTETEPSK